MIQRDEFLNYYIKSQVLAMALVKDNCQFAQKQAISRLFRVNKMERRQELENEIRDSEYMRANLEHRQKTLTEKNDELKVENGELGSFHSDGKIVQTNFKKIKNEVDDI